MLMLLANPAGKTPDAHRKIHPKRSKKTQKKENPQKISEREWEQKKERAAKQQGSHYSTFKDQTRKQSREKDVEKTVERKKSDEIYLYIIHTHSQYTRRHDTNTQLHKAFKISPTHRPISQFSLTKKIDPFHNLCKFTLTYP